MLKQDYFSVFRLPRKLAIDTAELQRRFYALAREHHPDFHQAAPPEELARVEATSALVNTAYRTLRDPIARVDYLVRLEEGRETKEGAADNPKAGPALLQEMFEIQEALAEARAETTSGTLDDATRGTLAGKREGLRARLRDEDGRLSGPLSARWDAAAPAERAAVLAAFKEALATRAYLRTVIDDLGEALGTEGRHGSAGAARTSGGMGGHVGAPRQ